MLLGPLFVSLRGEFQNMPKHDIRKVADIIVSAGRTNPEGISEKLMKGVCPEFPNIKFHFVVGALNPRIDAIRQNAAPNVVLQHSDFCCRVNIV